jgi:molecular chaperone HscA
VDAERLLAATASALAADGDLLEPPERANIDLRMRELDSARTGTDAAAIEAATQALAASTEAFAAERMNRSIHDALAGKRIDTL